MPPIGYESDDFDGFTCEQCDMTFQDTKEFRTHFTESHPESVPKFKRKVNYDEKNSRCTKGQPPK